MIDRPNETKSDQPKLIVIGGFAGSGKTTVSRRLAADLRIPRLGSDTIGRTIKDSEGIKGGEVQATWVAYEVLFRLCEEFVQSAVSVILDINMGWEFQWRLIDEISQRHPSVEFLPIILRCPKEVCLDRIRLRHEARPEYYTAPEMFETEPKHAKIWKFLANLNRPEIRFVDGDRSVKDVYEEIREHISSQQ